MDRIYIFQSLEPFPLSSDIPIDNDYSARFYVRVTCQDGLGIIRSVGLAAEGAGVSIHSILQNPITNPKNVDFVVTTEVVKLSQVKSFAAAIAQMDFAKTMPLFMPML